MCSVPIGIVLMLVESLFTKLSVQFRVSRLLILKKQTLYFAAPRRRQVDFDDVFFTRSC